MTMRSQIPRPSPWLTEKTKCAECGKQRSDGNHERCSRARQARFAAENSSNG